MLIVAVVGNNEPRGIDIAQHIEDAAVQIVTVGVRQNLDHDLPIMSGPTEGDEYYTAVHEFPVFSQTIGPIVHHICTSSWSCRYSYGRQHLLLCPARPFITEARVNR